MEQTSYVRIANALTGATVEERHAVTCGHCSKVIHAKANGATASLDDVSKTCACCRRRVCLTRACVSRCVPIEKKIAAYEKLMAAQASRDALFKAAGIGT